MEQRNLGMNTYLRVFDRDFVDPLLAMTWPKYLRRYKYVADQWNSPEHFLTDFALDPQPEDDHLARRIVRSWTLRRTMRSCTPKIFFLEQLLESVPKGHLRCYTVADDEDVNEEDVCEDMCVFGDCMIDAYFEGRVNDAAFRAAMKLIKTVVRYNDPEVEQILQNDPPKLLFSGLPPLDDDDQITSLSTTETKRLFHTIEKGWAEKWLRDCSLASKLRRVSRDRRINRPVLVCYSENS